MVRNPPGFMLLFRSLFGVGGGEAIGRDIVTSRDRNYSVKIKYKNASGGVRERVVDVYSIGNGYIDAYDHFRREVRTFKFGRIKWTELTQDSFERKADYAPSIWVESG